jgi:hypothetical protein
MVIDNDGFITGESFTLNPYIWVRADGLYIITSLFTPYMTWIHLGDGAIYKVGLAEAMAANGGEGISVRVPIDAWRLPEYGYNFVRSSVDGLWYSNTGRYPWFEVENDTLRGIVNKIGAVIKEQSAKRGEYDNQ